MKIAFHQPNYLPNLSFFHKLLNVDLMVIPTRLQFVRREWHNRAKIQGPNGDLLLSIPVKGSNRQPLCDAKFDESINWHQKHASTLEMCYSRSKDCEQFRNILAPYRSQPDSYYLADFTVELILILKTILGVDTPIVVDNEIEGKKQDLLINLCTKYEANEYLSGLGGKHYMDEEYVKAINAAGITHEFVDKNITANFPYSSVHYICQDGIEFARAAIGN